jgi:serine/threonine protein kinase
MTGSAKRRGKGYRVLGKGGYGSVIALDEERVVKIQHNPPGEDGLSAAALREMAALRVLSSAGKMLFHRKTGVSAIEIQRYPHSLLDLIRATKRGKGRKDGASSPGWSIPVLPILADVVAQLRIAHAHGYVHRDVKPENVMIDRRGRARLIDWGMGRHVGSAGEDSARWTPGMATIWYRAPELFTGDPYGAAVDVWALGVMAVEVVTGRCPFRGRGEIEQLTNYCQVLGPPPDHVLPRWPWGSAGGGGGGGEMAKRSGPEMSRASSVWAAVPEIAAHPGLAELIDSMIRWDPDARPTAETLAAHPLLADLIRSRAHHYHDHHRHSAAISPSFLPLPPLTPARLRVFKRAIVTILAPLWCTVNRIPQTPDSSSSSPASPSALPPSASASLWCAARFLWRAVAVRRVRRRVRRGAARHLSKTPPPPFIAKLCDTCVCCLDVAQKLVNLQCDRVSSRIPGLTIPLSHQVDLVNLALHSHGLADGVEQGTAAATSVGTTSSRACPVTRSYLLAFMDACLLALPERTLPIRDWRGIVSRIFRPVASFVLTGQRAYLTQARKGAVAFWRGGGGARGSVSLVVLTLLPFALRFVLRGRGGTGSLWRRMHPQIHRDLTADATRRRRLVAGLAAISKH